MSLAGDTAIRWSLTASLNTPEAMSYAFLTVAGAGDCEPPGLLVAHASGALWPSYLHRHGC
jgi:hypothetical protein